MPVTGRDSRGVLEFLQQRVHNRSDVKRYFHSMTGYVTTHDCRNILADATSHTCRNIRPPEQWCIDPV